MSDKQLESKWYYYLYHCFKHSGLMAESIYKIVVLGEGRVGKTSISIKYVRNEFDDKQKQTVNASYLEKKLQLDNDQRVKLTIWDTAGQEQYNSVAPIYYRQAVGAIVCYDITSVESLAKAKKWITELQQNVPKGIVLTIAGNKADLETNRKVPKGEAEKLATSCGAKHFIVSAKNGQNIKQMFKDLAERVHARQSSTKTLTSKRGPMLVVEREKPVRKEEKKCCS